MPVVSTIPSRDRAFRRVVERTAMDAAGTTPEGLAERLRSLYPQVAVVERGLSGERRQFYVYRDGRYVREREDRWWEADRIGRIRISVATGVLTHVSAEWVELMGTGPADLVGRHYSEFVLPEARAAATAMFEALVEQPEVQSEALVVRPDGTTLVIEFRARREDGEIDVRYRPLS